MRTEKREVGRDQRNVWWFSQGVALLSLAKDQSLSLGKGAYCRLMTVLAPVCQVSLPGEPEMAGETPYSPACLGTWVFHQMSVLTDASLPKLWGSSFSFCVKTIKGNWLSREKKAMVPTRCVDVRGYGGYGNRGCMHSSYLCTPPAKWLWIPSRPVTLWPGCICIPQGLAQPHHRGRWLGPDCRPEEPRPTNPKTWQSLSPGTMQAAQRNQ